MILKAGPGKIIMPDGTEIDVMFDIIKIEFDRAGFTYADFQMTSTPDIQSIASGGLHLTSNQTETVEINGKNPCRPSGA